MIFALINIIFFFVIVLEIIIKMDNVFTDAICSYLYEIESLFFAAGVYY